MIQAVRANVEGKKESTQVESIIRHILLENGNAVMPSEHLPSPRSKLTVSRTTLKQAYDKARITMSFNADCRGKRSAQMRHERRCRPYLSTVAPQRHLCGA